ncbi:MAG TPA: helix-turn-helix transcriptional regulator [Thermoanaerobaculia bacterium]|jgi:transcriptional regulator with XRE-family HTH domain|nr:helix-turn-helix transcriptional regulator [Thermoanaerobaculia bacterium]
MDDELNQTTTSLVATKAVVGRRIAEKRAAAHLSQRAFASSAGLNPSRLAKVEIGRVEPRFLEVAAIARALGLSLDALAYASQETSGETEGRPA